MKIERSSSVCALQWNVTKNKTSNTLSIGCMDGTLSFYDLSGKQVCYFLVVDTENSIVS